MWPQTAQGKRLDTFSMRGMPKSTSDLATIRRKSPAPSRCGMAAITWDSGWLVSRLPTSLKHLDEKVARLHLDKLGVKLTRLTPGAGGVHQVKQEGP
jgi:hypothetical protein